MSDVAMLTLSGRVVNDAELAVTPNGTSVLKFSVACNRWRGNKQHTSFYDCVVWGRYGEIKRQFATKGQHISIGGHLDIDEFEGTNGKVRKPVVTVHTLEPSPMGGGEREDTSYTPKPVVTQPIGEKFDDDIPF
jgi:single-strand DNA-binding protein